MYLIGVLLVVQAMGFDLLVIWTGAAALLVGIGIGLQQTFNDLICGVIILFERSVKVGDVVELTGHQVGTVRKIGARTSVVESRGRYHHLRSELKIDRGKRDELEARYRGLPASTYTSGSPTGRIRR